MFAKYARKAPHSRKPVTRIRHVELLEGRRLFASDLPWGPSDIPVITEYDLATGQMVSYEAPAHDPLLGLETEVRAAGFEGLVDLLELGTPTGPVDPLSVNPEVDALAGSGPDAVFGPDGRTRVNPTTGFPWRTVGLTAATFPGVNGWSWCSAAVVGPFHVLTAAHCIRNSTTDPSPNTFANSLEFVAASNGVRFSTTLDPDNGTQSTDRPYGTANATFFRAYTWNNSSWDYDIALVTLDRRIGNFTGWMGYGWNTDNNLFLNQTMNSAGYPTDRNDTNGDGNRDTQYMFHSADPITSVTTHQLRSNQLDTNPGHSGGPLWRYVSATNERTIYGVTSHQNSSYNGWTRITQDKYDNLIVAGMNDDNANRPPTDRADLVDWDRWYNTNSAFMNSSFITPGGNFSVTAYPRNNGTASAGNYTVSFYASTNTTISTSDFFLGSVNMGSLAPFNWDTATLNTAFPTIPAGNYYVGWILDSGGSVSEFLENNNTGYLRNSQLTVGADDHGNNAGNATPILADSDTAGNLESGGDTDWFSFRASAGASISLSTTLGSLADSTLTLYASDGVTQLAFDDDGGPGLASLIQYTIPGQDTYYVKVADFGSNDPGSYTLSLTHLDDHGDSAGLATLIGSETVVAGDLEVGGDTDWFWLHAADGAQITLETTLLSLGDSILRLYDSDGTTELAFDDDGGPGLASRIDFTVPHAGYYYVCVEDFGTPDPGSYLLALTHADDHGDAAFAATPIAAHGSLNAGTVEVNADLDFFAFDVTAGTQYTLQTILGTLTDTTLALYDTDGLTILDYNDDYGGSAASTIVWTAPATGTYYAQVTGSGIQVGTYDLIVSDSQLPDGDFNDDGQYDCTDINLLVSGIAAGSHPAGFDLTGDGLVNLADRDAWLAEAGAANLPSGNPYLLGDANLDGIVDGSDFGAWNAHKFTALAEWCSGDFNADGVIDGSDFGIWNVNKFTAALRPSVPASTLLPQVQARSWQKEEPPRLASIDLLYQTWGQDDDTEAIQRWHSGSQTPQPSETMALDQPFGASAA